MTTILDNTKNSLGINADNLGFDQELLVYINGALGDITQIGVSEFANLEVTTATEWPVFGNTTLLRMIQEWLVLKTKIIFDAMPSETIARTFTARIETLEGRINHELEEVEDGLG